MAEVMSVSRLFMSSSSCRSFLCPSFSRSSLECCSSLPCSSSSFSSHSYLFPDSQSQVHPCSRLHFHFSVSKASHLSFSHTSFLQWSRYIRNRRIGERREKGERRMVVMASLYRFGREGRVEDIRGFEGSNFSGDVTEDNTSHEDENTWHGEHATWKGKEFDTLQGEDSDTWQGKAYDTWHGNDYETWQGGRDTWQQSDYDTWQGNDSEAWQGGRNSRRRGNGTWQMEDEPGQRREFDWFGKGTDEEVLDEYPWLQNKWSVFFNFLFSHIKQSMAVLETRIQGYLPSSMPRQLISIAVNGGLVLTVMWLMKSLLEVLFTIGKTFFIVLLLISSFFAIGKWIPKRGKVENKQQKTTKTRPRRRKRSTNETDFDGLYRNQNYGYS